MARRVRRALSWLERAEEAHRDQAQDTAFILYWTASSNQLLHGGATWNSSVNRSQVATGAAIMAALMPRFIDGMIEHPDADWGSPRYPVD